MGFKVIVVESKGVHVANNTAGFGSERISSKSLCATAHLPGFRVQVLGKFGGT